MVSLTLLENLKMQEIARRLDVTATEAFRQLDRLSTTSLVKRLPDGAFTISEYGNLVLQVSSSLEFISKHKHYFETHNIMQLPPQFSDASFAVLQRLRGSVDGVVAWMQLVRRRRLPGWRLRLETRLPRRE